MYEAYTVLYEQKMKTCLVMFCCLMLFSCNGIIVTTVCPSVASLYELHTFTEFTDDVLHGYDAAWTVFLLNAGYIYRYLGVCTAS